MSWNCNRCSRDGSPWEQHKEYCHIWQNGAKNRITELEKELEAAKTPKTATTLIRVTRNYNDVTGIMQLASELVREPATIRNAYFNRFMCLIRNSK